jgi:hypothetical protein
MPELVEVTQEDRDAAAKEYHRQGEHGLAYAVQANPKFDNDPLVQAFARHRLKGFAEGKEAAAKGWHPIETLDASKLADGDQMLIVNDRGMFVGTWDAEWMSGVDTLPNLGDGWWMIEDGKDPERPLRGDVPTHWMPLPDAPVIAQAIRDIPE